MVWLAETTAGGAAESLKMPRLENDVRETFRQRFALRVSGGARPLNEAKLVVLGRGSVGKTSLVNRLLYDRLDEQSQMTEGIIVSQWPLSLTEGEQVRLNVWDFGGQEIMHATHQFFLTERSLYLIVLTGREGGEEADADY
jgi:internalin A